MNNRHMNRSDQLRRPRGRAKTCALALALCLGLGSAAAHEGHAHPGEPVRAAAALPAAPAGAPRFVATSLDFELVGVLEGRRLTLWLDRADTNAPVVRGSLALEVGEVKLDARPEGDAWVATLPTDPAPGTLTVTASLAAEGTTDLLAGELLLPAPAGPQASTSWLAGLWQGGGAALPAGLLAAVAATFIAALAAWRMRRRRA